MKSAKCLNTRAHNLQSKIVFTTMLGLSLNLHSSYRDKHFQWNIEDQRKHWLLSKHCSNVLFAKSLRNLPLTSFEAKFYWHRYVSKKKYNKCFENELRSLLHSSLLKASCRKNLFVQRVLISEQLINLDQFDPLSRKNFIQMIISFIRNQSLLESVCLEGLDFTENEISEILSVFASSSKCIKFLLLWRVSKSHARLSPLEENKYIESYGRACCFNLPQWLHAITSMKYLESISLNYIYIASTTGDELIIIAKSLKKSWKLLQLLCLENELTVTIPDCAWNEARKWSPTLRVQLIFLGISQYDQHKRFLTQSMPIQALYLSTNLKLLSHYPCMIDCTLKTIYRCYHRHLVQLYLNLWNVQETFDNHLRKVFPSLPNLETFEFLGFVRDAVTIHTMCCQIKFRVCAVKKVDMRLKKIGKFEKRDCSWLRRLECVLEPFKHDFDAAGISFGIYNYPC